MSTVTNPIILDSTGQAIAQKLQAIADSNAVSQFDHNSLCRNGVELNSAFGGKYTVEHILAMVQSGNFSDIYVGDTITTEITTTLGGAETVELLVAGINSFGGDMVIWDADNDEYSGAKRNHLALITKDCLKTQSRMNATNTASGGYMSSEMATTTLPVYLEAFESVFGAERIFAPYNLLCNSTDFTRESNGDNARYYESDYLWYSEEEWENGDNKYKIQLLTEREVFGQNIFNHSYDGCNAYGMRKQLPIFKLRPDLIQCGRGYQQSQSTRQYWWLQDVARSISFPCVLGGGYCDIYNASVTNGVRPLIYIG